MPTVDACDSSAATVAGWHTQWAMGGAQLQGLLSESRWIGISHHNSNDLSHTGCTLACMHVVFKPFTATVLGIGNADHGPVWDPLRRSPC